MKRYYNIYFVRYECDHYGGLMPRYEYNETVLATKPQLAAYLIQKNKGINLLQDYAEFYKAKELVVHELN